MSEQPSLLELFEQSKDDPHLFPPPRAGEDEGEGARRALNPFRKRYGVCIHCGDDREQCIFWCHICRNIGCFEWLKDHKD